jgi:multidrug resistance protein
VSRAVLLVCATAFLYMLGLSVLFPVLPHFVQELGIGDAEAGVLLSSYALGTVLTGSLWGRFSQRVGRKPTIMLGLAGFVLAFLFFALGQSFPQLLAARFIGGLLAGALMPAIPAYIADVTDSGPQRGTAMGLFGASAGLGVMFGVGIGGLLGELGPRVPFLVSAGIGAVTLTAVAILLPESLKLGAPVSPAARLRLTQIGAGLGAYLAYSFLVQTSRSALEVTIGFLARDKFGAGPGEVGLVLFGVTLLAVLIQGGAMRPLGARFSDRSLLFSGTVLLAVGLVGVGFVATWGALCAAGAVCGTGAALVEPTFRAELSRVGEDFQGEAQGLNSSVQSLARVTAFLIFPWLFAAVPVEVVFGVAGTLAGLAAILAHVGLRG